jgi:hypothetical protein
VELRYLYVGSADIDRDLPVWLSLPGTTLRWRFKRFGADVAALDTGSPPAILLADHRSAGTILPIYAVGDLEATTALLGARGWRIEAGPAATPEGPVSLLVDPSGVEIALLSVDRPGAMERAFADRSNHHGVHSP